MFNMTSSSAKDRLRIPSSLCECVRDGRLIPFVGAGVSMAVLHQASGKPLFPSWSQLFARAADFLDREQKQGESRALRSLLKISKPDYLYVAKMAQVAMGPKWNSFLKSQFDPPYRFANPATLTLARCAWNLNCNLVITTNYDRVLYWSCPESADMCIWDIEAPAEQVEMLRRGVGRPTLWHLHGNIHNASRLILTPDGYGRLYPSDPKVESTYRAALTTLRALLATRSFLFIGFSLDDIQLIKQMQSVDQVFESSTGPHFALIHEKNIDHINSLGLGVECVGFPEYGGPLIEVLRCLHTWTSKRKQPQPITSRSQHILPRKQTRHESGVDDPLLEIPTSTISTNDQGLNEFSTQPKLRAVMSLIRMFAHDMRSPLLSAKFGLDILSRLPVQHQNPEQTEIIRSTRSALDQTFAILEELSRVWETKDTQFELTDLRELVSEAVTGMHSSLLVHDIRVRKQMSDGIPQLFVDRSQINRVLTNLLQNAIEAMQRGGTIIVRTFSRRSGEFQRAVKRAVGLKQIGEVIVEVEDNGIGINKNDAGRLFQLGFTTKQSLGKQGLGLHLCKRVMELHSGSISIRQKRKGVIAMLSFPILETCEDE